MRRKTNEVKRVMIEFYGPFVKLNQALTLLCGFPIRIFTGYERIFIVCGYLLLVLF